MRVNTRRTKKKRICTDHTSAEAIPTPDVARMTRIIESLNGASGDEAEVGSSNTGDRDEGRHNIHIEGCRDEANRGLKAPNEPWTSRADAA